jgi:hypothetical protein
MADCRQGKTRYRTEGEARAAIRGMLRDGRGCKDLRIYPCRDGDHFHLTRQASIITARTPPKLKEKAEPILSPAKLRRKLANAGAQIVTYQRRLDAAEAATAKAEEALRRPSMPHPMSWQSPR